MVRGKGRGVTEGGRTLTHGEMDDLKGQKQEAQATLKYLDENPMASRGEMVDKAKLKKEMDYYDKVIDENTVVTPRGVNKDKIASRVRELEETMKTNMPSREEMDHPGRRQGAVRKHMNWMKHNDNNVREYKELQKRLNPEDPTAMDIERLRKEK